MSCPAINQIPLAAIVYAWAWFVLFAWSYRHASSRGTSGIVFMAVVSFFWPLSVLILTRRSRA